MKDLIKKILKEGDFDWVKQHMEDLPETGRIISLTMTYGNEVIDGIETQDYTHYGITVYKNGDDEEYTVGTEEEFDTALVEYYENLVDDVGIEGWNILDPMDYVMIDGPWVREFVNEMTDSYIDDLSDDDILSETGYDSDIEELDELESELTDKIESLSDEIDDMEMEEIDEEEIDKKRKLLEKLEEEKDGIDGKKDNLIDEARDIVYNNFHDDLSRCMEDDPLECLVESQGFYSTKQEQFESLGWRIDSNKFPNDLAEHGYYGELSSYDGEYETQKINDEVFYLIRVN